MTKHLLFKHTSSSLSIKQKTELPVFSAIPFILLHAVKTVNETQIFNNIFGENAQISFVLFYKKSMNSALN